MSKELNFQFGDDVLKYQDSNSALNLSLSENGYPFDLTRIDFLSLKFGNDDGFLLEKTVDLSSVSNPESGNVTIPLDEDIMTKLFPGDYNVELWASVNPIIYNREPNDVNITVSELGLQNSQAIFPSDGNLVVTVDDNIDSSPTDTITSYALDDVWNAINQWEANLAKSINDNLETQLSLKASNWQNDSASKLKDELLQEIINGGDSIQQQLNTILSKSVNDAVTNQMNSLQQSVSNNLYQNVANEIIAQVNQKVDAEFANENTSIRNDMKSFIADQITSSIGSVNDQLKSLNDVKKSVANLNNDLQYQTLVRKAYANTKDVIANKDVVSGEARDLLKEAINFLNVVNNNVDFSNFYNVPDGIYILNGNLEPHIFTSDFSGNGAVAIYHCVSNEDENVVAILLCDVNGSSWYKLQNRAGETYWSNPTELYKEEQTNYNNYIARLNNIDSKYTDPSYKQNGHVNTPAGMMNDIQSITKIGDHYNIYYLNNDVISFQSEWQLITTKDFKTFEDCGVAIHRNTGDWQSVATGSVIKNRQGNNLIDSNYPADALFAYFVSFTNGKQNIERAYSSDNGVSFNPTQNSPVINQPSNWQSFRDPCATYDSVNNRVVLYITTGVQPGGGDYISAYTSTDGINFDNGTRVTTFNGQYTDNRPGNIECPVVISNIIDKADNSNHAVMFISGNSGNSGNGCYYQLGQIQNGIFVPDSDTVTRLDSGIDTYASNYTKYGDNSIVQLAWLGDWQWQYGNFWNNGVSRFGSIALPRLLTLENGQLTQSIIEPDGLDYQYALDGTSFNIKNNKLQKFSINFKQPADNCMLTFKNSDSTVTFNFWTGDGQQHITTQYDNVIMPTTVPYVIRVIPKTVSHLIIYSDKESLEIVIPEIGQIYTVMKPTKDENMLVEFPYEAIVQTTDIR